MSQVEAPRVTTEEPLATNPLATNPLASEPLRRETILPRERQQGALGLALLCTLAGIASGFAVATTMVAASVGRQSAFYSDGCGRQVHAFLCVVTVQRRGETQVIDVYPGAPAAAVGIEVGDTLRTFDGMVLDRDGELGMLVRSSGIGHVATITVDRGDNSFVVRPQLVSAFHR